MLVPELPQIEGAAFRFDQNAGVQQNHHPESGNLGWCRTTSSNLAQYSASGPGRESRTLFSAASALLFQLFSSFVDQRRLALEHFPYAHDLPVGFLPLLLLNGFAHTRQRLDAIAGIESGRVDLVLEPG